jgi:hypothetical protein
MRSGVTRFDVLREPKVKRFITVGTITIALIQIGGIIVNFSGRRCLIAAGVAVLFPIVMCLVVLIAVGIARFLPVDSKWCQPPTSSQWLIGIPTTLAVVAFVGVVAYLLST